MYTNDIGLSKPLVVLEEEDILLDRKDAQRVRYLSSGATSGVHAVAVGFGRILDTQ
jgi:hypothetical protein